MNAKEMIMSALFEQQDKFSILMEMIEHTPVKISDELKAELVSKGKIIDHIFNDMIKSIEKEN